MHLKYLVHPTPPLIVNSAVASQLSVAALKRNLTAHAISNPTIIPSGTKAEMAERLEKMLKIREADLMVREMIWGDDN